MAIDTQAFLDRWHRVVATKDFDGVEGLLADGITVGAPPYWTRLEGKDMCAFLLRVILATIEDFTYHREWVAGRELALEFRGQVGKRELQGIDLITLDESGLVVRLDVMIRPINALLALRDAVAPQMQSR